MGRPTKFTADMSKQAALLCELGATDAQLAQFFKVARSTIDEWKLSKPGFSDTIKSAKEIADAEVEASLFQRAKGYSHPAVKIMQHEGCPLEVPYTEHYPPETVACIFWLKNRQPAKWRDKQELEHSGEIQTTAVLEIGFDGGSKNKD